MWFNTVYLRTKEHGAQVPILPTVRVRTIAHNGQQQLSKSDNVAFLYCCYPADLVVVTT
jgi:hypothetical protein